MALFLVALLPLFFLLLAWLPWGHRNTPEMSFLVGTFFKGILAFFPGFVVILIFRKIFGFSYDGFLLFLSLLQRDHLFPLLVAVGSLLVLKSNLQVLGTEEECFLGFFSFLAGFMTVMNIADLIRTWGNWNAYLLFLLPIQRLSVLLFVSLTARRFFPWEGRNGILLLSVAAIMAIGFTVPAILFFLNREGWSVLLTVLPLLAAILWFTMRFPRLVRAQ
jgi:hypothetical protein